MINITKLNNKMNLELLDILIKKEKYTCKFYKQNEIIKNNKCFSEKIYLIKEGVVKICSMTTNGEEIIPVLLAKNQIFGADIIFGNTYSLFYSESLSSKTKIYEFEINDIYNIIKNNNSLYKDLLCILDLEYSELEKRIKTLQIRSTELRLINAIIEFKEKFEYSSDFLNETIIINSPFNQDELANYIRTSRVTTNNLINGLKNRALINYQKKNITLKKSFFNYYKLINPSYSN